jgi:hypothetical protein
MKTIIVCNFDNVACLFDRLPESSWQVAVIFGAVIVSAIFATVATRRM